MKIKIKRIDRNLPLPQYHSKGAVGFDIYSRIDATLKPKEFVTLPSNLIIEIPEGYMLAIFARSSTFKKKGLILANSVGIVDQDFCGEDDEILIQLFNLRDNNIVIESGERIAQGIFIPVETAGWEEVSKMKSHSRGGIGSTG